MPQLIKAKHKAMMAMFSLVTDSQGLNYTALRPGSAGYIVSGTFQTEPDRLYYGPKAFSLLST